MIASIVQTDRSTWRCGRALLLAEASHKHQGRKVTTRGRLAGVKCTALSGGGGEMKGRRGATK